MTQPEALIDKLDKQYLNKIYLEVSEELRRLHEVNQELVEALERLLSCAIDVDHGYLKYAIDHAEAALTKARKTE